MNLKSQKGYSLIEIGIGIVVITVFLFCSVTLFNGCYNTYRVIIQRNTAMNYAVTYMENALQMSLPELLEQYAEDPTKEYEVEYARVKNLIKNYSATNDELKEGKYAVPEDRVVGSLKNSLETNNMRITTKVRRIPVTDVVRYDNTVLLISVTVEYALKPVKDEALIKPEDTLKYELNSLRITTNKEGV